MSVSGYQLKPLIEWKYIPIFKPFWAKKITQRTTKPNQRTINVQQPVTYFSPRSIRNTLYGHSCTLDFRATESFCHSYIPVLPRNTALRTCFDRQASWWPLEFKTLYVTAVFLIKLVHYDVIPIRMKARHQKCGHRCCAPWMLKISKLQHATHLTVLTPPSYRWQYVYNDAMLTCFAKMGHTSFISY